MRVRALINKQSSIGAMLDSLLRATFSSFNGYTKGPLTPQYSFITTHYGETDQCEWLRVMDDEERLKLLETPKI